MTTKKTPTQRKRGSSRRAPRKWSAEVMRSSDALDLESDIFKSRSPKRIAESQRAAAETPTCVSGIYTRRKSMRALSFAGT